MENGRVYWSNWAGLSDVTSTMQVQRGLGASRLAISSVGGTINIILKDGATATDQELRDYCLGRIAKHKCPRYVSFVTEFPMNAAGKILKYKMREEAVEKLGLVAASKIVTA